MSDINVVLVNAAVREDRTVTAGTRPSWRRTNKQSSLLVSQLSRATSGSRDRAVSPTMRAVRRGRTTTRPITSVHGTSTK